MTTKQDTAAVSFDDIPGELPQGKVPEDTEYNEVAGIALEKLNNLDETSLASNVIWRDLLAVSDTFRTFYSPAVMYKAFRELFQRKQCSKFNATDDEPRLFNVGGASWLDIDFTFKTTEEDLIGSCAGVVSLIPDPKSGEWKIWMLRTWLESYEGHGHPDHAKSTSSETVKPMPNQTEEGEYDVIIVGGGQGGLGVAGRLKALGINHILLDQRSEVGKIWSDRYASLRWHTIKEYSNLPLGRTFNPEDPDLLPATKIAAGYKAFAERYGLNVRTGTNVTSAEWDDASRTWTVAAEGTTQTWTAKNLVLSVGPGSSIPSLPSWASPEKVKTSGFKGTIVHSADFDTPDSWKGKRGVVVGTGNTAHDIAEDLANADMETTMMQRNPTFVFPGDWLEAVEKKDYNMSKPTSVSDRQTVTQPNKILRQMANAGVWAGIKANPERFDALEKAGFKVDRYGDIFTHLYIRFGGHYVDTGASGRIVKGEIKVKSEPVKELTENGLLCEDGSTVEADLIVLATGYDHDFRKTATELVGKKVADQMDNYFGVDAEGELRGHARLSGRKSA